MTDVRFIRKDGQSVDTAVVRKHFFESVLEYGASPARVTQIWNDAIFGDQQARGLIEDICEIDIVDADAGFGFLE
jgi:hypothetical protein